jgi:hypothetical protein
MATPTSGADVWLTMNGKPLLFQENEQNLDVSAAEKKTNVIKIAPDAPESLEILIDGELLPGAVDGDWYWIPEKYAGLYELQVRAPGHNTRIACVRVQPEKLTQERYEAMLADIREVAIDLLFRLNSPAGEKVVAEQRVQDPSPLREYEQIILILKELKEVMAQIRRSPYQVLNEQYETRLLHEVQQFSHETTPLPGPMQTLPDHIATTDVAMHVTETWHVPCQTLTYDVHENRLLKQFIQCQLVTRLNILKERAENEIKRRVPIRAMKIKRQWDDDETPDIEKLTTVVSECQSMVQRCLSWSNEPFLKKVKPVAISGKATQMLLKNPSYSRFYRLYLNFQQELKISLNTENYVTLLALRKVCDLYEIWSVFQITRMVIAELSKARYTFKSSNLFFEVEKNSFQFEVRKNISSIVLTKEDITIHIKYEPVYPSYPSVGKRATLVSNDGRAQLTPDLAIEVYRGQVPIHIMVFDAKYRWRTERDSSHAPQEDDLNKMYRYYCKICYKTYNTSNVQYELQEIVSSAYILYPGDQLYRDPGNHIGALPLVPKMSKVKRPKVAQAVREILRLANLL